MNAVIYARFSSHNQTEQSIEGQLQVCNEYANANNITVIGEYIDRATSATTDKRPQFQKMISDSKTKNFEIVLVYQFDRFARSRQDSAIYKAVLKKNGVRVVSAKENITEDPAGILVEGFLESIAEYFSADLSVKIRRGMDICGEKCLSTGSNPGLGLTVNEDKRIVPDPITAPIVKAVFEQYAAGETVKDIIDRLNALGLKTSRGNPFNKNSFRRMLQNKRYIGIYTYKGKETPNAIPRIIDDALFEQAQARLMKSKAAPAQARAKAEYLLTTKLFCGHCREMMIGHSGTSKSGTMHHYYKCKGAIKKACHKKPVNKDTIENLIVNKCRELLTDNNIKLIAREVSKACATNYDDSMLKHLKEQLRVTKRAIDNLLNKLEDDETSEIADIITARLKQRVDEKKELERKIAIEGKTPEPIDERDILFFLYALKKGNVNDEKYRRLLINVFLVAAYLYDDKITYILTTGKETVTITDSLLDAIEESNSNYQCSLMSDTAPPKRNVCSRNGYRRFLLVPQRIHGFYCFNSELISTDKFIFSRPELHTNCTQQRTPQKGCPLFLFPHFPQL